MSPRLWHGITKKRKDIRHDPKKSDAWSLGLVILEAGLDKSVQDIYDKDDHDIHEHKLKKYLHEFREQHGGHNSLLCDIEDNLLQVDEDKRLGCLQLMEQVPKYNEIVTHLSSNRSHTGYSTVVRESNSYHKTMADHVGKVHKREEVVVSSKVPKKEQYVSSKVVQPVNYRTEQPSQRNFINYEI